MPLLAVWYQARATIAEALVPVLAGLKTAWLLFGRSRFSTVASEMRMRYVPSGRRLTRSGAC
ncbi:MAG: hypothetical protein R2911_03900 [Caldilineaceae bacterium]